MSRKIVLAALLVLAACREDATAPTSLDPVAPSTAAAAVPLTFQHISTGEREACGVAVDDRAYCWGISALSAGTVVAPHPLQTVLRFKEVRIGFDYGCAITKAGAAFCWGSNDYGQLGDGTTTDRHSPKKIAGGLSFLRLSTGAAHTCGVTSSNKAYCWGLNNSGQLGDGTSIARHRPNPVSGNLAFAQVSAALTHSCGVTTDHRGYCWGRGAEGQLGYGDTHRKGKPILVAGGIAFSGITTGNAHTCGTDTGGRAWCWGFNASGQVGDGTSLDHRLTPVRVSGELRFDAVLASFNAYTCGIATSGRGYCWGENTFGYLGDGTTEARSVPTPIAPPS